MGLPWNLSHDDPNPNPDILDHGDLYVARCEEDGTLNYFEKFGHGDLTPQQGFHSQPMCSLRLGERRIFWVVPAWTVPKTSKPIKYRQSLRNAYRAGIAKLRPVMGRTRAQATMQDIS